MAARVDGFGRRHLAMGVRGWNGRAGEDDAVAYCRTTHAWTGFVDRGSEADTLGSSGRCASLQAVVSLYEAVDGINC